MTDSLTDDLTNIKKDYYTSAEVAEIKGVTRQAVNNDIHAGKYPGAFQLQIGKKPWLIPKAVIDNSVVTQDVVTLTRHMTPGELQQLFNNAVQTAVRAEIEQLKRDLTERDLVMHQQAEDLKETLNNFISETRAERKAKTTESKGFFSKLFGK